MSPHRACASTSRRRRRSVSRELLQAATRLSLPREVLSGVPRLCQPCCRPPRTADTAVAHRTTDFTSLRSDQRELLPLGAMAEQREVSIEALRQVFVEIA